MKMPVEIKYTIEVDVTDEEYLEMKKNKKLLEDTIRALMLTSVGTGECSPIDFRKVRVKFAK